MGAGRFKNSVGTDLRRIDLQPAEWQAGGFTSRMGCGGGQRVDEDKGAELQPPRCGGGCGRAGRRGKAARVYVCLAEQLKGGWGGAARATQVGGEHIDVLLERPGRV